MILLGHRGGPLKVLTRKWRRKKENETTKQNINFVVVREKEREIGKGEG